MGSSGPSIGSGAGRGSPTIGRSGRTRASLWLLAAVTGVGLLLRVAASQQSLFGDELFTYPIVTVAGLGDLFDGIELTENTPPAYYVAAWLSAKLGDGPSWIRLPSILYGTAAIPAVFLLTARAGGRRAGLVAAGLMAVAPFAVFYASEARAYAGLLALLPISTYALLRAVGRPGSRAGSPGQNQIRWWLLFWAATTLALYTHYTAIFVVAAQGLLLLGLDRQRWVPILVAHAAVAAAYLPWLGRVSPNPETFVRSALHQLDLEPPARVLAGHPFAPLGEIPGWGGLALLLIAAAAVALGLVLRQRRGGAADRDQAAVSGGWPAVALFAALAISTPVGVAAYTKLESGIFSGRNLIATLPYAFAVAGLLTGMVRARTAALAAGLAVLALGLGTAKLLGAEARRPPWNAAAEYLEARAGPENPVIQFSLASIFVRENNPALSPSLAASPLFQDLALYLPRTLTLYRGVDGDPPPPAGQGSAELPLPTEGDVFVVTPDLDFVRDAYAEEAARVGATLLERRVFDGLVSIVVSRYGPER